MLNLICNSDTTGVPAPGSERVQRLMFASRSRLSEAVFSTMLATRAHAMQRNLADNVFVALLIQSGWFMEWMEGPESGVHAVLDRVARDKRHHSPYLLHQSDGPRRLMEPWSMASVQTHEPAADFTSRVMMLHEEHKQGRADDPAGVWRRLSTPLTHPGAAEQADEWQFQRVMVVAAVGTDAFNLVRWLGDTFNADIVHRRFVGSRSEDGDVATDYCDLPAGPVVRRVIAMSQNGLKIGLTRAFLSDYSHVILLMSGIPGRDHNLLDRFLRSCAQLAHHPIVVGVGPPDTDHATYRQMARTCGHVYLDCEILGEIDAATSWAAAAPVLDQQLPMAGQRVAKVG